MSEMTDVEHEQKVRSRKYSGPTIPEAAALLRLLDAERARADAAEAKVLQAWSDGYDAGFEEGRHDKAREARIDRLLYPHN